MNLFASFLDIKLINYIDLGLSIILLFIFCALVSKAIKKTVFIMVMLVYLLLKVPSLVFGLSLMSALVDIVAISFIVGYCVLFQSEFYKLYTRNAAGRKKGNYDIKNDVDLCNELTEAVLALSESNTGAIITIERNDSLDFYINKSVRVNCPVSKEMLATIFYNGTRLHDGAVVIRGNMIIAASVYYTPTGRGLMGAYGARHRAGIGISEHTDSLTIIVSEETGRISFAERGELVQSSRERFPQELRDRL